jgi:ubiquinone/menaquinone biosynthesis C-methylase UbiE
MTSDHNERVLDQFSRQAQPYANLLAGVRERDRRNDPLLEAAQPVAGDQVLDVGCGTGHRAVLLASRVKQVTGFDLTPAMLEQARRLQSEAGLANLTWMQGDATALPFDEGDFTLVLSQAMFHHAADPAATLREMRRVCVAGGRIAVSDLTPPAAKSPAFDAIEMLRDPSHAHALTLDALRTLGADLGLAEIAVRTHRTEMPIESVLAASRPPPGMLDRLRRLYQHDAVGGADAFGLSAQLKEGAVWVTYPMSIVVWRK